MVDTAPTETASASPNRRAAVVGLFFAAVLVPDAWVQAHLLFGGPTTAADWARLVAAVFVLGWLPGWALAQAGYRLARAELSEGAERLLFWTPTALALLATLAGGLGAGPSSFDRITLIYAALAIAAFGAPLAVPSLRRRADGWLAPVGVGWVASALAIAWMLPNLFGRLPTVARFSPLAAGAAAPALFAMHAVIRGRWQSTAGSRRRRFVAALCFGLSAAALVAASLALEHWLVGLYLPVKTWLVVSAALGIWLLFDPVFDGVARAAPRLAHGSYALAAAGAVAVVWAALSPVPTRFGDFEARSVVGLAMQAVSTPDDRDADGFYDVAAGGNDCDDADPSASPTAWRAAGNCWHDSEDGRTEHRADAAAESDEPRARNVILIIVDALRADTLDVPNAAERFPNFSRFADDAVVFERAYPPGNATLISVPPILTGVAPLRSLDAVARQEPVGPKELLAPRSVLAAVPDDFCAGLLAYSDLAEGWVAKFAGTHLDFARAVAERSDTDHGAPLAVAGVRRVLDQCGGRRLALALYVDDPHHDYAKGGYTCRDGSAGGRECYLQEIEVVDRMFGELLELLDERGMRDNTLIAVTADHGEAFREHGHTQHATSAYEEQIHVPLWVDVPDARAQHIGTPVSLLGFKPTALDALGLVARDAPLYPSWIGLLDDANAAYPAPVVESWMGKYKRGWASPTSAIIDGDDKLIYHWRTLRLELYDLSNDPEERNNLAQARPERAQRLLRELRRREAALLTQPIEP